jgi:hypothetical protein
VLVDIGVISNGEYPVAASDYPGKSCPKGVYKRIAPNGQRERIKRVGSRSDCVAWVSSSASAADPTHAPAWSSSELFGDHSRRRARTRNRERCQSQARPGSRNQTASERRARPKRGTAADRQRRSHGSGHPRVADQPTRERESADESPAATQIVHAAGAIVDRARLIVVAERPFPTSRACVAHSPRRERCPPA